MTRTAPLSCLLALFVAGLAQGIRGSLRVQDPGPRPLELKEVFKLFQVQFNRSYSNPAEHARRLDIFAHNLARAQQLQEEDLGTAEFGVTPFSDLTEEEFGRVYGHQRAAGKVPSVGRKVGSEEQGEPVPPTCDWRNMANIISPIQDQVPAPAQPNPAKWWEVVGMACTLPALTLLFTRNTATAAGPWRQRATSRPCGASHTKPLWKSLCRVGLGKDTCGMRGRTRPHSPILSLLTPELLDCGRCGDGCQGGFVWDAFITVLNNSEYTQLWAAAGVGVLSSEPPPSSCLSPGGLASAKDYPFQGHVKTHRCQAKKYKKVAWIQDFIMLQDNEQRIAQYLATHGPITVTINMKLLKHYQKGVIKATPTTCNPQHVDHSVLLVGFGRDKQEEGIWAETVSPQSRPRRSIPYWILKNSWGAHWGEKGYFRLHRGNNTCGITKYPLTARVGQPVRKRQVSCPP
nr:cathepsin W isoform X2 [Microcebus murinus]